MDGLSTEEMARQNLLDRILNCVKQVQVYFGARQEIATESDMRVSAMCTEWEMLMSHGAKKHKTKTALRLTSRSGGVSLWPLAKLCLSAEDLQRFIRLNHVQTELGRGRAWLRAAINERTLENYFHILLAQEEQIRRLYESHAFLLDQERSSMLPVMAAGLSSIIFSITVDATYLNTLSRLVDVPSCSGTEVQHPPLTDDHHSHLSFSCSGHQFSKNNKLVVTQHSKDSCKSINNSSSCNTLWPEALQDTIRSSNNISSTSAAAAQDVEGDDVVAVSAMKKKRRPKKQKSKSSQTSIAASPTPTKESSYASRQTLDETAVLSLKESVSSSSSRLSLDLTSEDSHSSMYVALPTTSTQNLVSSEALAAVDATAQILSVISEPVTGHEEQLVVGGTACPPSSNGDAPSSNGDAPSSNRDATLLADAQREAVDAHHTSPSSSSPPSKAGLKTALIILSRRKQDLETENRTLAASVRDLEGRVQALVQGAAQSWQKYIDLQEAHVAKMLVLERENDVLREQLKKYVSMVQARWKDTPTRPAKTQGKISTGGTVSISYQPEELGSSLDHGSPSEPLTSFPNVDLTLSDHKLQQMAEMYADLMELNERLHKDLAEKDSTICTLVRSIKHSSIEIPVQVHNLPYGTMETRPIVDVHIPSVIKKGRGPETHHVYQVFVSVQSVEWNIYRRYTEFREFHRQLLRHVPEIADFSFPPKKAIGHKSAQVVEERRLRLQEYLRFVIKTCSAPRKANGSKEKLEAVITPDISKTTLVAILPFFNEDFNMEMNAISQSTSYGGL